MPEAPTRSRRSERTAQTRQALVEAALALMSRQGYDAISTDDIAAAAGVSPRTFFRYFPTKESVLLFGEDDFIRSFAEHYREQPTRLCELDAVRATFVALAPTITGLHRRIRLYNQALASSFVLRGQEQAHHDENVTRVAGALAGRRGLRKPDDAARLLATVVVATLQTVVNDWAAGPARADLGQLIADRFALHQAVVRGR